MSRLGSWLPVGVMAAVIFSLSSIPGDRLTLYIFSFQDLLAHAAVFGILAYLVGRALQRETNWPALARVGVAVVIASLYGVSDEVHQLFVPLRHAELKDAAADVAGAVLGAGLWHFLKGRRARGEGEPG